VANHWMRRLLSGTRGRLLAELRRSPATVNALTERLAISANAVRSHLAALERDGIVVLEPLQKQGVGKPAYQYRLTGEARSLTPNMSATPRQNSSRWSIRSSDASGTQLVVAVVGGLSIGGLFMVIHLRLNRYRRIVSESIQTSQSPLF